MTDGPRMDGLEQTGVDGKQYAGYGVWFGALPVLNCAYVLPGQRQTKVRPEKPAALHVLKIVPAWLPLQICTDSQLVVDTILYWLAGWERRGWKTKPGKPVENADLWQEIKEALVERTAPTWWVKVPSHMGVEGNEQADRLAKEGVKRHGVELIEESKSPGQQTQQRIRGEEEQVEVNERQRMVNRYATTEVEMPKAKRERRKTV